MLGTLIHEFPLLSHSSSRHTGIERMKTRLFYKSNSDDSQMGGLFIIP